jgi:hypothetical protein
MTADAMSAFDDLDLSATAGLNWQSSAPIANQETQLLKISAGVQHEHDDQA